MTPRSLTRVCRASRDPVPVPCRGSGPASGSQERPLKPGGGALALATERTQPPWLRAGRRCGQGLPRPQGSRGGEGGVRDRGHPSGQSSNPFTPQPRPLPAPLPRPLGRAPLPQAQTLALSSAASGLGCTHLPPRFPSGPDHPAGEGGSARSSCLVPPTRPLLWSELCDLSLCARPGSEGTTEALSQCPAGPLLLDRRFLGRGCGQLDLSPQAGRWLWLGCRLRPRQDTHSLRRMTRTRGFLREGRGGDLPTAVPRFPWLHRWEETVRQPPLPSWQRPKHSGGLERPEAHGASSGKMRVGRRGGAGGKWP